MALKVKVKTTTDEKILEFEDNDVNQGQLKNEVFKVYGIGSNGQLILYRGVLLPEDQDDLKIKIARDVLDEWITDLFQEEESVQEEKKVTAENRAENPSDADVDIEVTVEFPKAGSEFKFTANETATVILKDRLGFRERRIEGNGQEFPFELTKFILNGSVEFAVVYHTDTKKKREGEFKVHQGQTYRINVGYSNEDRNIRLNLEDGKWDVYHKDELLEPRKSKEFDHSTLVTARDLLKVGSRIVASAAHGAMAAVTNIV